MINCFDKHSSKNEEALSQSETIHTVNVFWNIILSNLLLFGSSDYIFEWYDFHVLMKVKCNAVGNYIHFWHKVSN